MQYLNRELSWIDFNERVLAEACSNTVPLLERLKFIGIVSSNFDEFFMVRVAALHEMHRREEQPADLDSLSVKELLGMIGRKTRVLFNIQEAVLNNEILPQLGEQGLVYRKPEECTAAQQGFLEDYFYHTLYPLIKAEIHEDEAEPADSVANVRLHIAFLLSDKRTQSTKLAIVQVPDIPRFIFLPAAGTETKKTEFVLTDELIRCLGAALFSGFKITGTAIFKINRSATMTVDDSSDDGFIQALQEVLVQRRYSFAVRMTCTNESPVLVRRMARLFGLEERDIYLSEAPIGLSSFAKIAEIDGFKHLRNEKWRHYPHPLFPAAGFCWETVKKHDILLNVPYQSYKPVIKFLSCAAEDPDTVSIQMTLYRTSKTSPVVHALERAAKNGKKVRVFVELKARFDEERNLGWVKRLQKYGVSVIYDLPHLKVHAKLILIMRREPQGERGYVHLSTGNYNDTTAKLYSDLSLFTARPEIVEDAQLIFSRLCGKYTEQKPRSLITAPDYLKKTLLALIEREEAFARAHQPARIAAKINNLSHPELITALYRASQAGVRIDLNVRGICMLIPGRPGISENIRVISIIDRYLEHSRVFYFENGGNSEYYLASADWMPRNLERRVELFFPVFDPENRKLLEYFFNVYFADNVKAFEMQPDGSWQRPNTAGAEPVRAQQVLQHFFNPHHKE